jgi:hypothetical protein
MNQPPYGWVLVAVLALLIVAFGALALLIG